MRFWLLISQSPITILSLCSFTGMYVHVYGIEAWKNIHMYVKLRDKCLGGHSHVAYEHWGQRLKYPFPPLSVLITVLWPWEKTMIKIIKSENYLLGVLLTSYSMIIVVASRLARRQTWNSSSNWEFISDLQVAGRDRCGVWWWGEEGECGGRENQRDRETEFGPSMAFWNYKVHSQWHSSFNKATLT